MYIGATKRPLEVRIKEYKTHTKEVETLRSDIAEHVWDKQHHIKWSDAESMNE